MPQYGDLVREDRRPGANLLRLSRKAVRTQGNKIIHPAFHSLPCTLAQNSEGPSNHLLWRRCADRLLRRLASAEGDDEAVEVRANRLAPPGGGLSRFTTACRRQGRIVRASLDESHSEEVSVQEASRPNRRRKLSRRLTTLKDLRI